MNIVLDFDRTLFDTSYFADWFAEEVAERSGLAVELVKKQAQETYYVYSGELYYYDMIAHLTAIFGADANTQLEEIRTKARKHTSFLFEDVQATLDALKEYGTLSILTFGKEDYQRFKLSLCPQLEGIPAYIVQDAKGPHLAANFEPTERCVFIDDKDEHGTLPEWVEFYHLQRSTELQTSDLDTGVVKSFRELLTILSAEHEVSHR